MKAIARKRLRKPRKRSGPNRRQKPDSTDLLIGSWLDLPKRQLTAQRQSKLLQSTVTALTGASGVTEIIDETLQLTLRVSGVQRAAVALWDSNQSQFQQTYSRAKARCSTMSEGVFELDEQVLPILPHAERPLVLRRGRAGNLHVTVYLPLRYRGTFVGVLCAQNLYAHDCLTRGSSSLLEAVAAQAAVALLLARTQEELARREAERSALKLYLPPAIVESIIDSGDSLRPGGQEQEVVVLFADVRGFTKLAEQLEPADLVEVLNEYLGVISSVILDAGGTIDKFIGDSVMALFGAPAPIDQPADRALAAALVMQEHVKALNQRRRSERRACISVGVGLHAGPAVVGNIGTEMRLQYTAIGDTVNVAARLVDNAAAGQVLITQPLRAMLDGEYESVDLGEVAIRGRTGKLRVYSVTGAEGD